MEKSEPTTTWFSIKFNSASISWGPNIRLVFYKNMTKIAEVLKGTEQIKAHESILNFNLRS